MPDRRISKDRVVAAVRWRARKLRKKLRRRRNAAELAIPAARFAGVVEMFSKDHVTGWVAVKADAPPTRVSLLVNDLEVAATWATDTMPNRNNWGEIRPFNFRLRDIWAYSKTKYKLTVRVEGKALPIVGHGMFLTPPRNGRNDLAALKQKLDAGNVFGQTGKLQLSKKLDTEWQSQVMDLYGRVAKVLQDTYGYDVFFVYGTLLGAVREGGVIGHDLDFDSAFLSKHTDGPPAAKELQDIAYVLIEHGFDVECMRTALHIHHGTDPSIRIDLFHLYFDGDGKLCFPFGVAGTTEILASDWRGTSDIEFCGGHGLVPANAEQFVEHMYGAGWRSPKPGFDWKRDRTKRAWTGVLPPESGQEVYWANFYARTGFTSGSSFFEMVSARGDVPGVVVDVGCGDGRDSLAFAAAGCSVLGVDRCEVAVRRAVARARQEGLSARFVVGDVADGVWLRAVLDEVIASASGPVLFYLRFVLHSVAEPVQEALMGVLGQCARVGDLVAAEFRTEKDEGLAKAFGKHFRRFQNGPAFGVALGERWGFEVLEEQEGTGLAPYRDEDPELYRVIARRSAGPGSAGPGSTGTPASTSSGSSRR
jgi:SAM-dependent methyltransferase